MADYGKFHLVPRVNIGIGLADWLKRDIELIPYDTHYSTVYADVGIETHLPNFPLELLADAVYSYTGGSDINLGSHRHLIGLDAGLRFAPSWLAGFFLDGRAGVALALNSLDFGKGFPIPESEPGLNLIVRAGLGYKIFWGSAYVAPKFEYALNQSIAKSDEPYLENSLLFSIELGVNPDREAVSEIHTRDPYPEESYPRLHSENPPIIKETIIYIKEPPPPLPPKTYKHKPSPKKEVPCPPCPYPYQDDSLEKGKKT